MAKKEKETLLSVLAARFFGYNLLRRAFLEEPSLEFLKLLKKDQLLDFFPGREKEEIKSGAELAAHFLKESPLDENTYADTVGDYNYLFGFGVKKGKDDNKSIREKDNAPPYESVYRSKKPLVFQEETIKVRREYMKHGLLPKEFMREPDDHIGFELDFMGQLGKRALDHLEKDNIKKAKEFLAVQRRFLRNHLLKWVPEFSAQILKRAQTDFYRGLAKLLKGYLEWDVLIIPKIIEDLEKLKKPVTKEVKS